MRNRPTSAMPRASTPLSTSHMRYDEYLPPNSYNRETLNSIIPDMPSMTKQTQSTTALLYSKFIMKGIKTNKIDLVKDSFNMKKDHFKMDKKLTMSGVKTLKSTRNQTKQQVLQVIKNKQTIYKNQNNFEDNDSRILGLEINNYFKVNTPAQEQSNSKNGTQRKMIKTQSQGMLKKRPKTATISYSANNRNSRAQTANSKNLTHSRKQTFDQFDDIRASMPVKNLYTVTPPVSMQARGFTNFIERNKRQASASSSKKTSIYLTGVDNGKMMPLTLSTKQIKKIPFRKYEQNHKHSFKKSMPEIPLQEDELILKDNRLSEVERVSYAEQTEQNVKFMKKNMPKQYQKYMEYLVMQQCNYTQKDRVLLSKDICQNKNQFAEGFTKRNQQDDRLIEANQYFDQFVQICEETQFNVKKNMKVKKDKKSVNQIVNVFGCQKIIQLQEQRKQLKKCKPQSWQQEISQINLNIFEIIKILSFFKGKSQQICLNILNLDFEVVIVEEDQYILKQGEQMTYLFVILSGSVLKQTKVQKQNQDPDFQIEISQNKYTNTDSYFDGDSFGDPQNHTEVFYDYSVIASQKTLLMKLPFKQCRQIFAESQNVKQKLELLRNIFGNIPGNRPLEDSDLEAIAFKLQTKTYLSKQIIFRQGDECDMLIIIGKGNIVVGNEHILKRKKKINKDMKHRSKSTSKLEARNYSVNKLRRNNLKNYEIVKQNEEQFVFYYQNIDRQLIKGDTINWEGFSPQETLEDQRQVLLNSQVGSNYKITQSLISNSDDTTIYTLRLQDIRNLPEIIKQSITAKVEDYYKKKFTNKKNNNSKLKKQRLSIENPFKWDAYKQKLCNQIIESKIKL